MNLTFAANLTKMIDAGLGREAAPPETFVAVGRTTEYTDLGPVPIASFETNVEAALRALSVSMEPIQDLHGQSAPYPAGGGKNKLDYDTVYAACKTGENSFLGYNNSNDEPVFSSINVPLGAFIGQQVTFSAYISVSGINAVFPIAVINGASTTSGATQVTDGNSGYIAITVTPETADDFMRMSYGSGRGSITFKNIMLEVSASRTEWSPYSNICPISGRESVTVTRAGANLFNPTDDNKVKGYLGSAQFVANSGHTSYYFPCAPNTTYTVSKIATSANGRLGIAYSKEIPSNGTAIYGVNNLASMTVGNRVSVTTTTDNDAEYIIVWAFWGSDPDSLSSIQLELGSTATAYEPYNGQQITLQLGQTVYGGTVDAVSGALTVDRRLVTLGDRNWELLGNTSARQAWRAYFSDIKPTTSGSESLDAICSEFKSVSYTATWIPGVFAPTAASNSTGVVFCVESGKYADAEAFKEAMSDVQFCYKLAQPQTITLTPEQITTLIGANNVWSDGGNVSLTYGTVKYTEGY